MNLVRSKRVTSSTEAIGHLLQTRPRQPARAEPILAPASAAKSSTRRSFQPRPRARWFSLASTAADALGGSCKRQVRHWSILAFGLGVLLPFLFAVVLATVDQAGYKTGFGLTFARFALEVPHGHWFFNLSAGALAVMAANLAFMVWAQAKDELGTFLAQGFIGLTMVVLVHAVPQWVDPSCQSSESGCPTQPIHFVWQ